MTAAGVALPLLLMTGLVGQPSPQAAEPYRIAVNVDLVVLARLAPEFEQVPDLFEAYNRAAPPAPLPEFLGALSTLVGFGMLTLA